MAKLVDVYRNEQQKLGRRQLPLQVDENLTVSRPCSQPQRVGGSLDPVTRIFPRQNKFVLLGFHNFTTRAYK